MARTAGEFRFGVPVGRVDARPDLDPTWTPAPIAEQTPSRRYLLVVAAGILVIVAGVVVQWG